MASSTRSELLKATSLNEGIDRACDQFERAWQVGESPRLETFLAGAAESDRLLLLLELLLLDLEYRRAAGDCPLREEYVARFPGDEGVIDAAFEESQQPPAAEEDFDLTSTVLGSLVKNRLPKSMGSSTTRWGESDLRALGEDSLDGESLGSGAGPLTAPRPETAAPFSPEGKLLYQAWPFSELPGAVVDAMARRMRAEDFAVGDALLRQGEPGRRLLFVVQGQATVSVHDDEGDHTIAEIGPGVVVGEMSLLTRGECTATVTATSAGKTLALDADEFHQLASSHLALTSLLSHLMANRLGGERDVLQGKNFHGFRLGRCVGRGGMGMVYEAEEIGGGRKVALKMMSHRFAYDSDGQRRFDGEARIGQELRHPHIVPAYEQFSAFNTQFIAMQYCAGRTLAELIAEHGPLADGHTRRIAGQLGLALYHAHAHDIIHRDLKPENVLLDDEGNVYLTDFGLARALRDEDDSQRLVGTPRYMAPEQLLGEAVDERADYFSFGCIVFELITGRALFPQERLLELICKHATWTLPPREEIRPGLGDDIYTLLSETLGNRPVERSLNMARLAEWAGHDSA